ncbi:MAG: glyoxalase [Comamonadaceae bacterium SCN 68-20]|jgi:predicted enzyme related to lactoylglutathione lyase|nr:VOC family protein [Comamonadaceae bacterium]ODU59177.1 MAG: glyoxalase [Comamonadaceae bacterium SCN 68-20]OJX31304.1 MAG: glyoxalase [Burkholderiales bacterium 68-20]UJB65852.1 VOC family protein [Acidovorax sp. YS12]
MQFGYTILYVEDVPATVAFYEAAFGLRRRFVHEAGDFGELDTGATALAFSSLRLMAQLGKSPQRAVAGAPCCEIAFTTADVAAAVERAVRAGAALVQPPEAMPWGQTVAYVHDNNGFLVELCTPMGAPQPPAP